MKTSARRTFLKSGIAAGLATSCLHSLAYAAPKRKGWIELFDGKTLEGWHINPEKIGHGTGGQWEVENLNPLEGWKKRKDSKVCGLILMKRNMEILDG